MTTSSEYASKAASISQFLDESAARYCDAVAFTCGTMQLRYSEFASQALALAVFLQNLGVRKGDRVALMVPNLPAFPIATLGILKAGAVQVNVNPMYTASELQHQLDDSGAETLIVFAGTTEAFSSIQDSCAVKRVIVVAVGDGTATDAPSPPANDGIIGAIAFSDALNRGAELSFTPVSVSRDDLALLQYTGGTTGPSKGAMLTHGNVLSNLVQSYERIPDNTRENVEVVVTAIPLYHIFAFTVNFLLYTGCGARNVLITNPRDMDSFVGSMKNSGFTFMTGVNSLFAGLLMHPEFVNVDFSQFKAGFSGGTAALEATSDKWQSVTGSPLIQGYGLSETSPVLTLMETTVRTFTGQVGQALVDTDIKLLDDADNEVPMGERGELVAKGPQVTQGYYQRPDANAEAFTSDGYFRTGDIAIADEYGNYEIVDRKKDMVIVSGFNVYPNEVEQVAAKCEGVVECACLGIPDDKTGEAVRLFIVKVAGSAVNADDIVAHCREHLTAYKVPKSIKFIDELPKSAVGKMLRRVLRELPVTS